MCEVLFCPSHTGYVWTSHVDKKQKKKKCPCATKHVYRTVCRGTELQNPTTTMSHCRPSILRFMLKFTCTEKQKESRYRQSLTRSVKTFGNRSLRLGESNPSLTLIFSPSLRLSAWVAPLWELAWEKHLFVLRLQGTI